LAFDDALVSRQHAVLRVSDDDLVLQDLGSANGVAINGGPIGQRPTKVYDGDHIQIGHQHIEVLDTEARRARAAVPTISGAAQPQSEAATPASAPPPAAADRNPSGPDHPRLSALSPREVEVLSLIAHGHTNKEIAEQLHVSVKTVETHRTRIGQKLELRTRAEMVRLALDTGLLRPST
jgi:DNA-binding CsgD family transcriptional regulator